MSRLFAAGDDRHGLIDALALSRQMNRLGEPLSAWRRHRQPDRQGLSQAAWRIGADSAAVGAP